MTAAAATLETYRTARSTFWGSVLGSAGLAVAAHLAAPGFAGQPMFRLALALTFFAALASISWSFTRPFADVMKARHGVRFAQASPALRHTMQIYLIRTTAIVGNLAWIVTAAITACALYVLSTWHAQVAVAAVLLPLQGAFLIAAYAGILAVPAYLFLFAGRIQEVLTLRRSLEEQAELSGIGAGSGLTRADADDGRPAVEATGPFAFRAGGFEWSWGDFTKNAAVFGQSGSGKTVCVLNALLEGLVASSTAGGRPAAGLILDPKGDFRSKLEVLCRKYGRANDLMIIDPKRMDRTIRWNPLDSGDSAYEVAQRFGGVMETIGQKSDSDAFWIETAKSFVQNALTLLRAGRPGGGPPSLAEIYEAAVSDHAIAGMVERIDDDETSTDVLRALTFINREWMPLADNTKSVVRAYVGNMLGAFLQQPYDTLFAGRSTMRIGEMIDAGKILYVGLPVADQPMMARVVSTFVKLEFHQEVLRRPRKERPSFFLCDEFQTFLTTDGGGGGDADAFEKTRESNHANVIAFQNMPALLKRASKREPVDSLLGNCAVKLFLRNTDVSTNELASGIFGEQIETMVGTGLSISGRSQPGSSSVSSSAQYGAKYRKDAFAALAIPSREEGTLYAETLAHIGSRGVVRHERLRWPVHPLTDEAAR